MSNFNVGDKVRCIKRPEDNKRHKKSLLRKVGEVVYADSNGATVRWEGWTDGGGFEDREWYVHNDCIELVAKAAEPVLKFPIGSKVRTSEGGVGTVVRHDGSYSLPYKVEYEDGSGYDFCDESELTLITEDGLYIVIVEQDGGLAPSPVPRTYDNRSLAEQASDDMAKRHGGKFFVFKAVYASTYIAHVSQEKLD
jgi:hypothetical protein